jgi:predicted amidophosphoribosyltransferase
MSEIKTSKCPECGELFQVWTQRNLCPKCIKKEDEQYNIVKEFLYDNPNATAPEVSYHTGVPEHKIIKFLKEGRLISTGNAIVYDCECCGAPISSGRVCKKCLTKMEQNSNISIEKLKKKIIEEKWAMYKADKISREKEERK